VGRIGTRALAAAGAVAVMLAITAWPAGAQAAMAQNVEVTGNEQAVVPGGGTTIGSIFVSFEGGVADRVAVDLDLSDVTGFVEFLVNTFGEWECDTAGDVVHCEQPDVDAATVLSYQMFGRDGFPPGTTGQLRVHADVDGETDETTVRVVMTEPADLASADTTASAAPGTNAGLPTRVRNIGATTVNGTVLTLQSDDISLLTYRGNFSNCNDFQAFVECVFDADLSVNTTYRLSQDVPFRVSPEARTGSVLATLGDWWTVADWDRVDEFWKEQIAGGPGVPGTGPPLTLVEVTGSAAATAVPQSDTDPFNNFPTIRLTVTGNHPADLQAIGANATGAAGATARVSLRAKNLGPAVLHDGHRLEVPMAYVSVPEGTTAVEVSGSCSPFTTLEDWHPHDEGGTPGADEYACLGDFLPVGQSAVYQFGFRVDRVVPDAAGTFRVDLAGDPDEANDTAAIVINPSDDGEDGEDGGGGLPVTGASLGLVIATGALLLGLGVAILVLARRRPTVVGE